MNELLPIIRRTRRPLIEQESVPDGPPVAAVVEPATVTEAVQTEPPKPEEPHDADTDY